MGVSACDCELFVACADRPEFLCVLEIGREGSRAWAKEAAG
jgi:hypothetical protein